MSTTDSASTSYVGTASDVDSASASKDTISYSAARIRYRDDYFSLSHNALLTYKASVLSADSIIFYSKLDLVEAMGRPVIRDPGNPPIGGYQMRYNLKTKVGEIYYGSSKRDNQTFNGMEVRRQPDGDIHIARGDFSTCDNPQHKHYHFYSRRMILEPKSKVISGPVVMNIADVPVAILPMMVMPLGTGRRSGLIQPKFGGDQAQGFYLNGLGYYWAISDYMDFMLTGDLIEGEQGTFDKTNLNWNYRYAKRYTLGGSLGGKYYISEFDPSNSGWHVDFAHDQSLTPDGRQKLVGNGRFVSTRSIVDDNAITETEKLNQTANASLGYRNLLKWNQARLNVDFIQTYQLVDDVIDRSVPDAGFSVGGPLFPVQEEDWWEREEVLEPKWYQKLNYNYDNRLNINMVQRPDLNGSPGDTNTYVGYRDNLTLSGKYLFLDYLNLTPSISGKQIWSLHSRSDIGAAGTSDSLGPIHNPANSIRIAFDPSQGEVGDHFWFFNTGVNLDTRIYGIGHPQWGPLEGIRHTIIPSIGLNYAPELDSNPHFVPHPKISERAYQAEQRTVSLQLGNDVDIKLASKDTLNPKGVNYKILAANSSTSYNFANKLRPWNDISSSFSTEIAKHRSFTINTVHRLYDDYGADKNILIAPQLISYGYSWRQGLDLSGTLNSGLKLAPSDGSGFSRFDRNPWSASLNYNFNFSSRLVSRGGNNSPLDNVFGMGDAFERTRTHQALGGLKLNPTKEWKMSYDTEYNFSEGRFSKHSFTFSRTLHCWQMDFSWTPVGYVPGWNFNIRIIDLPDIKLETSNSRSRRLGK